MADNFKLRGVAQMKAAIRRAQANATQQIERALREEAEMIMTDSKKNYVPVDRGALRSSGYVGDVKRKGTDVQVSMQFGGPSAPYALAIHEHPSRSSPPSWKGKTLHFSVAGTGTKYLELPLRKAVGGMAQRIAEKIRL